MQYSFPAKEVAGGYEIIAPFIPDPQAEINRLAAENLRLKRRTMHQRRELRSLNKHVRYWSAVAKSKAVIQAVPAIEIVYANEPRDRPSMVPGLLAVAVVVVLAATLLLTR